jgi:KaiC/GvpD/RAD55 family RecA-like ATPase
LSSLERMPTGIPGLDEMIGGGLPVPSMILVAGDAGAGKTTFCTQFLCKGADLGERGLYFLTFGGPLDSLFKGDFRRFLLKLSHLVKAQKAVALVTGDALPTAPYPAKIAHVADGIILLKNEEINLVRRRSIEILKMCGTSHHLEKYAVDISVKGLTVYPGL